MKKSLIVSTIIGFIASFERSDIAILQEMGYEVHIACNCDIFSSREKLKRLEDMKIIKHHISFARNPFDLSNIKAYKSLVRLMKKEKFDIVHCHTPVGGVLGRIAANKAEVPRIIYTAHGFHFFKGAPKINWLLFYPIEKWLSQYTDILITINDEDYSLASKNFHAKVTERIHGVGVDIDRFLSKKDCRTKKRKELNIQDNEALLLSVGELDKDKNHIEVLEAMKTLGKEGFKFCVAGTGALEDSHKKFIQENGLEDCVKLLGYRKDIPELLQAADIYVFPSLFEGLSVALMEAVAARIPIACSEVRGNVDTVITDESYFPSNSPSKLIDVIRNISSMSNCEKENMVEKNYKNLIKYRLSAVQEEMKKIYKYSNDEIEKTKVLL